VSRTVGVGVAAVLGALGAGVAQLLDPGGPWTALAVLGAAVVAGELLLLRPAERSALPLSFAVVLVLLRAASPAELAITMVAAEAVAFALRPERSLLVRLRLTGTRLAAAAAALGVYELIAGTSTASVLGALAAAGVAEIVVDDVVVALATRRSRFTLTGRSADLALVTSGMLMSIGFRGMEGHEGMGLWGPLVFSVPLLAAVYSFERLAAIRQTYEQTLAALSVVPELGGLAREGHAERVARVCDSLGRDLGLGRTDLDSLRAAALLHHLGHLCLDDPVERGRDIEPSEVTDKGAEILRQTGHLAPAGDILASDTSSLASQILRVASAYDELTGGDPAYAAGAVEALFSGPGYVYDARVLDALERVVLGEPALATGAR
jgi:hypothetical protein